MESLTFSIDIILPATLWPWSGLSLYRNEYQEYFLGGMGGKGGLCVELTTLPTSCTDCLEIWEPQPPGTLRAFPGLYRDCFTLLNILCSHVATENRCSTRCVAALSRCTPFFLLPHEMQTVSTDEGRGWHHYWMPPAQETADLRYGTTARIVCKVFSLIHFSDTRVQCKYLYSEFTITQAWLNTYFFKKEVLLSKKEYTSFTFLMEMSVHRTHVLLIIFCSCSFLLCVFFTYPMSTFLSVHSAIWHSFTLLLF